MRSQSDTPWRNEGWWTSPFNFQPEVRERLRLPLRIRIEKRGVVEDDEFRSLYASVSKGT